MFAERSGVAAQARESLVSRPLLLFILRGGIVRQPRTNLRGPPRGTEAAFGFIGEYFFA
jgi:hypothetical protein